MSAPAAFAICFAASTRFGASLMVWIPLSVNLSSDTYVGIVLLLLAIAILPPLPLGGVGPVLRGIDHHFDDRRAVVAPGLLHRRFELAHRVHATAPRAERRGRRGKI